MNYFRDLTINQMIAVLAVVVIVLIGAMVAFNISRQPSHDPVPSATPFRPSSDFQFVLPSATPQQ